MNRDLYAHLTVRLALGITLALCSPSWADDAKCLKCHSRLTRGASVHKALNTGCGTCHSGIDARAVPHRLATGKSKGLSTEPPAMCWGCHEELLFTGQTVHPALAMGCTSCHDPHASKNKKLLKAPIPGLCTGCHDKAAFSNKGIHAPVAGGACLTCHLPHSSDQPALLIKQPITLCKQCHQDTPHGNHFRPRRPQSDQTGTVMTSEPQDPKRPGKPFYCGSCHDPHSTNSPLLFRFNAQSVSELCKNCHGMN